MLAWLSRGIAARFVLVLTGCLRPQLSHHSEVFNTVAKPTQST
jgi:hypothetical protein